MKKYVIALKELGIQDEDIILLLNTITKADFKQILTGSYLDIQYKYNIDLCKYTNKLSNEIELGKALVQAEHIIKQCKVHNIHIVLVNSSWYPANLKTISAPPPILYYKGSRFKNIHTKSIACVGSRDISEFGINAANKLVPNLVNEGFTIISGLAEGIDKICHEICLNNRGNTIAVLAHGLDSIYPKTNAKLAQDILNNGGILVSEYPPGVGPDKFRFVKRNRIVSGLSKGVLVIECKEKSGTMHTVNFCLEQNHPVFCPIPSNATLTTKGLLYILNNKKSIGIPTPNSFDIIIHTLGYRLKDTEKLRKIKATNASSLINAINVDAKQVLQVMSSDNNYTVSTKVDKDTYKYYREALKQNLLTNKDIMNAIIVSIAEQYKKKLNEH